MSLTRGLSFGAQGAKQFLSENLNPLLNAIGKAGKDLTTSSRNFSYSAPEKGVREESRTPMLNAHRWTNYQNTEIIHYKTSKNLKFLNEQSNSNTVRQMESMGYNRRDAVLVANSTDQSSLTPVSFKKGEWLVSFNAFEKTAPAVFVMRFEDALDIIMNSPQVKGDRPPSSQYWPVHIGVDPNIAKSFFALPADNDVSRINIYEVSEDTEGFESQIAPTSNRRFVAKPVYNIDGAVIRELDGKEMVQEGELIEETKEMGGGTQVHLPLEKMTARKEIGQDMLQMILAERWGYR